MVTMNSVVPNRSSKVFIKNGGREGLSIQYFGEELIDFTDTAALCELMDLIITVDTSVAHLAGALGKPTWLMVAHLPDYRWLQDRTDTPWYDSVRLFRQKQSGNWTSLILEVRDELIKNGFFSKT